MPILLELDSVTKYYDSKKVINNLSVRIDSNEFVALVGNNGIGKTTLIKIICNLVDYTGIFSFKGKIVIPSEYKYRKQIGVIISDEVLIDDFTVIEYLEFLSVIYEIKYNLSKLKELLFLFDIQNKSNFLIKNLSKGERMKILFISSLINKPTFLLYDEPFINIDIQTTEKFMHILKSFKGKKTLFITSHNIDLVAALCERFLIMDDGTIIMDINKSDYKSVYELKKTIKEKLTGNMQIKDISWLNL